QLQVARRRTGRMRDLQLCDRHRGSYFTAWKSLVQGLLYEIGQWARSPGFTATFEPARQVGSQQAIHPQAGIMVYRAVATASARARHSAANRTRNATDDPGGREFAQEVGAMAAA